MLRKFILKFITHPRAKVVSCQEHMESMKLSLRPSNRDFPPQKVKWSVLSPYSIPGRSPVPKKVLDTPVCVYGLHHEKRIGRSLRKCKEVPAY